MNVLRKLIAIALLAILGLPFAPALLARTPTSEANLPACCRHNGTHHCTMSVSERGKLVRDDPGFRAPADKCRYALGIAVSTVPNDLALPAAARAMHASLVSHPAGVAQTESRRRISRDRSRHKRGPPQQAFFLSL